MTCRRGQTYHRALRGEISCESFVGFYPRAVVYSSWAPAGKAGLFDSFSGSATTELPPGPLFGNRDMVRGFQVCHDSSIIGNGGKTGDHLLLNE